tara:strand:- start:509 stop:661 length:153 start_codon:yes stop_codon:yes gene_type:complete
MSVSNILVTIHNGQVDFVDYDEAHPVASSLAKELRQKGVLLGKASHVHCG